MKIESEINSVHSFKKGEDCTSLFKKAYENRYTWSSLFNGYSGAFIYKSNDQTFNGLFNINCDLKSNVEIINQPEIKKILEAQLWEVSIHRVRRPFGEVHGQNTFVAGEFNQLGLEVIVGGKNNGDSYRVNNNIVTMVNRHIHGKVIQIITESTLDTGNGYLSTSYTSQYKDTTSNSFSGEINRFSDSYQKLSNSEFWVLDYRKIITLAENQQIKKVQEFIFKDFK
tara:strand:+ start:116 stop:793 length:678 start_codon:yes stop_codon:yes gene_type:complete